MCMLEVNLGRERKIDGSLNQTRQGVGRTNRESEGLISRVNYDGLFGFFFVFGNVPTTFTVNGASPRPAQCASESSRPSSLGQ